LPAIVPSSPMVLWIILGFSHTVCQLPSSRYRRKSELSMTIVSVTLWLVVLACIVVGFVGTALPALPGTPLIFIGIVLAAWIDSFRLIGWPIILLAAILTVISLIVDLAATALGAKKVGASRMAVIGATIGTFVGIFFLIPGLILGPFVGAVAGELLSQKGTPDLKQAGIAGLGTWAGLLVGTAAKVALAATMVGVLILSLVL